MVARMESETDKCTFAGDNWAEGGFEFFGSDGIPLIVEFVDPFVGGCEALLNEFRRNFRFAVWEREIVDGTIGGGRFELLLRRGKFGFEKLRCE